MKAFFIDRYASKALMSLGEMPEPTVRENDVLVDIYAAGMNQLDAKIKAGEFNAFLPYKFPLILGHDVSGVVTKVKNFRVGDKIFAPFSSPM